MAWAPDYCTSDELADYVRVGDEQDAVEMGLAVAAASRAVDQFTGRQFGRVEAPERRLYTARFEHRRGRWVVAIDDLMTHDGLTIAFAEGAAGELFPGIGTMPGESTVVGGGPVLLVPSVLRPVNAAAEGRPWTDIVIGTGTEQPTGEEAEIAVTALWGWTEVPAAVKQATLMQASRRLSRRDSPFGVAGSPDPRGELRLLAKVDPDVEVSLRPFRKHRPSGGAVFA